MVIVVQWQNNGLWIREREFDPHLSPQNLCLHSLTYRAERYERFRLRLESSWRLQVSCLLSSGVELLFCKQPVVGSNPTEGSN